MGAPHGHGPDTGHDVADAEVVEVADGVFGYVQPDGSWWINTTGFVAAPDGVVVIDTCATERRTRAFLDAVSRTTPAPVRTAVNTHHHGDHTNGNCLLGAVTIVGHRNCRAQTLDNTIGGLEAVFGDVSWGDLTVSAATCTFGERLDLHVGDTLVELHHLGRPAHTTGDAVAWLPDQRVLFAGDLVFNGGTPFVLMGSLRGSIETIDALRGFGAATVVPGHGPVAGPDVLDHVSGYLHLVDDLARAAHAAGASPFEAAKEADLGPYAELLDAERLAGNLHRAYAELDGLPLGAPVDVVAAFGDMLRLNGGAPLRCWA